MKKALIVCLATGALLAGAVFALGDIARPKPSPSAAEAKTVLYTGLEVVPDPKASEARLQISQSTLDNIAREAGANTSSTQSLTERITHSSTRTIMAGLFMFLAVSFAGVWLTRASQRRSQKGIAALVLVAALFGAATVIVRANAGPPGYVRWQGLPQNLKDGKSTSGGVNVEIVPGDDSRIKLVVPLRKQNTSEE